MGTKKPNAAEKSTTRVSIHGGIRFRWRTAFFALAISGDFDGDGGSLRGGHAFGPVLIFLFTTVITLPGLHIFCLFLLPRQLDAQFLDEHPHRRCHRKGEQCPGDAP